MKTVVMPAGTEARVSDWRIVGDPPVDVWHTWGRNAGQIVEVSYDLPEDSEHGPPSYKQVVDRSDNSVTFYSREFYW